MSVIVLQFIHTSFISYVLYIHIGAIPLSASVLDLSSESPSFTSLSCTGNESSVSNCVKSMSGVCIASSNAAIRCLGQELSIKLFFIVIRCKCDHGCINQPLGAKVEFPE